MGFMKLMGNEDEYEIDEIDCFEKPFGIVLQGMKAGYSNIFYMFLKMVQAYNINEYLPIGSKSTIETEMYTKHKILQDNFNIIIHKTTCDDPDKFHDLMENLLAGPNVILIPGSLKELYYSKYYKRRNWPHLFLIKSFDRDYGLYYTLDSSQFYKENMALYRDFVIPYDIMKNVHFEYKKDFFPYIYYINISENELVDSNSIVKKCLEFFLNDRAEQSYREITFINDLFANKNSDEDVSYYSQKLFRTIKAKKVFLNELIKYLKEQDYNSDALESLLLLADKINKEWKKRINICFVHARKGSNVDLENALSTAISLENELYEQIKSVLAYLSISKVDSNKDEFSMFENNEDKIISANNGEYIFHFPKGKVYTSWFKDDSPKVIYKKVDSESENIFFKCTADIKEMNDDSHFHAGIFMRTSQGYVYFWGTHCGNIVRLDLAGIDTDLFSYDYDKKTVDLFIRIEEKKCTVGIIVDGIEKPLKDVVMVGSVSEIGLGCKSWDDSDEIVIDFKDFNFLTA